MLFRMITICLVLVMSLTGVLACSSKPPPQQSELDEDEVRALIHNDAAIILQHFNSLARSSYGKNYLSDLLGKDQEWSYELRWFEDGRQAGKTIGTNDEVYKGVTREHVEKAQFHRVTIIIKEPSGQVQVQGHWIIYSDNRILPGPNALKLEAELVK